MDRKDRILLRPVIHECCGDNVVLDCSQSQEEDQQPILREEVEIAVPSLKSGGGGGHSAGVAGIP